MIDISYTALHAWLDKDYRSTGMHIVLEYIKKRKISINDQLERNHLIGGGGGGVSFGIQYFVGIEETILLYVHEPTND